MSRTDLPSGLNPQQLAAASREPGHTAPRASGCWRGAAYLAPHVPGSPCRVSVGHAGCAARSLVSGLREMGKAVLHSQGCLKVGEAALGRCWGQWGRGAGFNCLDWSQLSEKAGRRGRWRGDQM